ncbi:MAG: metallophosphoesterase family protein [Blastocatellia bacterium]
MNDDLKKMYRLLGHVGPLPGDAPQSFGILDAAAEDPAEVPPLDLVGLEKLEQELKQHPRKTLEFMRESSDTEMTMPRLRDALSRARQMLEDPAAAVADIEAQSAVSFGLALPPDFTFPGMNLDEIPIDPDDRKFENDDLVGIFGWIFGAGPFALTQPDKDDFIYHNRHPELARDFIYELEDPPPGEPLEIALFSDFGVGRYYSKYIAKQFGARKFPYAIHLGDVYFAGRKSEFEKYFESLLDPILDDTTLFALNSNHEMYSGGKPYFDYIKRRRIEHPVKQKQEGSYFCLRSEKFQIIGIDTAFFGHGRYREDELKDWLEMVLREGRRTGRVNILLSADHPYDFSDEKLTKLLRKDLKELVIEAGLVDLWFWGNTHYCALYNHKSGLPFVGSCIGHGGYPYEKYTKNNKPQPAPIEFLEEKPRFPEDTGIRQEKGSNGYCVMSLNADGSLRLQYIDWMSEVHFTADLARNSAGQLLTITPVTA